MDVRSLLIVEDDPALSGYLRAILTDIGFEVGIADSRETALPHLQSSSPPALLVLDLGLPPAPSSMREGLGILDECLRRSPSTKVIVLTGQDENAAALEAVRRGAFDFLLKPVAVAALVQAVRRAELFARQEARMVEAGEARLQITARVNEGPREAAAAAEEQLLRRTLADTDHNVAETARRLSLAREHVYYYLKKYGLRRPG
ncbi:response regulator [Denitratisoma sp. DHT3]|uniref:response regulator n=1 Tax=Denitratisoma sp. DHT3 TaxID=1981880 RepID=UPI0016471942|nr:response regulator [Denitratisoma sp. DHT3]